MIIISTADKNPKMPNIKISDDVKVDVVVTLVLGKNR